MKLQTLIFYFVWILFFIVIGISLTNYHYYGTYRIDFSLFIIFIKTYPIQIIVLILILLLIIYLQYKLYKEKLLSRRNCQIQFVELERIAQMWLEGEELEENIEQKLKDLMDVSFDDTKREATNIISILMGDGVKDLSFYQKYIFPYLEAFSNKELEIISNIYILLENKSKDIPSVATIFKDDSDKKNYAKKVTNDKTSYEILKEVDLYSHTMNVVDNMYKLVSKDRDSFTFVWSKCLIVSLAHDVGKIENIDNIKNVENIHELIYSQNTHEILSKFILSNAFPDYEFIDDICEIIEKHHIVNIDQNNKNQKYISLLNEADTTARQNEIKSYLQDKKNANKNIDSEYESITNNKVLLQNNEAPIIESLPLENSDNNNEIIPNSISEYVIDDITKCYTIENIGNIVQKCINNINKTEELTASGKIKILSISNNDDLLIPKEIFYKYIKEEKIDIKDMKKLNEVLEQFKKDGIYKQTRAVKINNFINKAYHQQKEYVLINLNSLGCNLDDIELIKRNEPYLRNTEIQF